MFTMQETDNLFWLNLGCGRDYKPGYINIDYTDPTAKVDVAHDLNTYPYPFRDASVEYTYARNVIEHLSSPVTTLLELRRITAVGGRLHIIVPCDTWPSTYCPTHKTFWNWFSFSKVSARKGQQHNLFAGWELSYKRLNFTPRLFTIFNLCPKFHQCTFLRYLFPAKEIEVELIRLGDEEVKRGDD